MNVDPDLTLMPKPSSFDDLAREAETATAVDEKSAYEVGYGKPPCQTRFKKGHSGNPKGRTAGDKNLSTLLSEALNERVVVTQNGRRRKITKRKAIVTQLVNRSATADPRALKLVFDMVRETENRMASAAPETASFSAEDEKVIAQLMARLGAKKRESDD
jgi:hypothetical protein